VWFVDRFSSGMASYVIISESLLLTVMYVCVYSLMSQLLADVNNIQSSVGKFTFMTSHSLYTVNTLTTVLNSLVFIWYNHFSITICRHPRNMLSKMAYFIHSSHHFRPKFHPNFLFSSKICSAIANCIIYERTNFFIDFQV